MSDQSVPQKLCKRCGIEKPATEEYFKTSRHGNLSSPCRDCYREIKAEWRANNPDKVKKYKKESHERNRETDNARTKKWADENREHVREQGRQYYRENFEARKAYHAQWQRDNPDKVKARNQRWIDRHPEHARSSQKRRVAVYNQSGHGLNKKHEWRVVNRIKLREQARTRYWTKPGERERQIAKIHRRRMTEGGFTPDDIKTLLEEQEGRCAYCGITLHGTYHIDHMIPLAKDGTHDRDNLRIACPSCNLTKSDKLLSEWEAVRGW